MNNKSVVAMQLRNILSRTSDAEIISSIENIADILDTEVSPRKATVRGTITTAGDTGVTLGEPSWYFLKELNEQMGPGWAGMEAEITIREIR